MCFSPPHIFPFSFLPFKQIMGSTLLASVKACVRVEKRKNMKKKRNYYLMLMIILNDCEIILSNALGVELILCFLDISHALLYAINSLVSIFTLF